MSSPQLWQPDQYQLLDFGNGRKLEQFGSVILDRPCPAASGQRLIAAQRWREANLCIDGQAPQTERTSSLPTDWRVEFERVIFELRLTPFGHVGLFPEHALNWRWLSERFSELPDAGRGRAPRLLNLFAYTGGASLALAARGWEVVHVDSSAPAVAWARRNAQLSGLGGAPIRWIVDDARSFAAREVRRGRQYDAIVLDPPSYGHGPKGKPWQIDRDLQPLLADCSGLLSTKAAALVLTGHSEDLNENTVDLAGLLEQAGRSLPAVESGRLSLSDTAGRQLDCGWFVRGIWQ